MSIKLRDVRSREPTELPDGVERILRFGGVVVRHLASGREVKLHGKVNLDEYGTIDMTFTSPTTARLTTVQGISFQVIEEDGVKVDKPLNVISKRLLEQLMPDLEDGSYLKQRYRITAIGKAPKRRYQVVREPI